MFYRGKHVLVSGGTGFLGSHIVERLLELGARVRVPVHNRPCRIQDPGIETTQCDLTRPDDCRRAVKGVDYVFQVAGPGGSTTKGSLGEMSGITANLQLTSQLLHASWAENVDRFLMLSSTTVYPPVDHPVTEEEAWSGPTHPAYLGYGWMHRYLEQLCQFVSCRSDMQIAVARAGAVYGRWDNFEPGISHVVPALIRRAVEKHNPYEVWGTGEDVWDFFHVTDLARGCVQMLEKRARCDPVNLGYGQGTAIKELVGLILKAAGHKAARLEFNTTKPTTAPIRLVDTVKAQQLLDFTPSVSLEDGLRDTVEWYANRSGSK